MGLVTTRGIVLKRRNHLEADRIMTVFTYKLGKIVARARGARRPLSKLSGHIEPFTESNLTLAEGKLWYTLTEANTAQVFPKLRESLPRSSAAYFMAELIDTLTTENQPLPQVYQLLRETLLTIEGEDIQLVISVFIWRFLGLLGYKPELFHCTECNQKIEEGKIYFSARLGGLLDEAHKEADIDSFPVSVSVVKLLRISLRESKILSKITINMALEEEFRQVVFIFSEQFLPKKLKSISFYEEIQGVSVSKID